MGVVVGYFILAAAGFGAYATVGRRKKEWPYKKYLLALALVGILCMAVSLGELLTDTSTEVFELKRKEA